MQEKDFVDAIKSTIDNMEEGAEYLIEKEYFDQINIERKKHGHGSLSRKQYTFMRKQEVLYIDHQVVKWDRITLSFAFTLLDIRFNALALAFTFALAFGKLEKMSEEVTCDGKLVEIEGKKYKLVLQ